MGTRVEGYADMKLLICTQAVDNADSNLGFFTEWIREFASHCESVEVICLRSGAYDLPRNVRVRALGAGSRVTRAWRFWRLIFTLRREYDAVFVHMNPEYLVLGGVFWKLWHKKTALWYAHRSVTAKLRIATFFADDIFTVSPESFRIDTPKKHAVGHGIDSVRFTPVLRSSKYAVRLITIGRVSASKHLLEILPVLDVLDAQGRPFSLEILGEPLTALDREYLAELEEEIAKRPYASSVHLAGAVSHHELHAHLVRADVALNLSTTGNMDKAGLEALATGLPLVTTNQAFAALGSVGGLFLERDEPQALAAAIIAAAGTGASEAAVLVRRDHSLAALIPRILAILDSVTQ